MLTKDRFIIPMELELPDISMEAEPSYGGLSNSHSVSGEMVSFVTDIPYRLGDLKVAIEAVQDLHGYDHPWVGGAGKNKFHFSAGRSAYSWSDGFGFSAISAGDDGVTFNGTATSGHTFSVTDASMTLPAGTYRVTTQSGDIGLSIMVNGSAIVTGYGTSGASFTLNAETEIGFSITVVNGASFSNKFVGFQIENGETASDWTPYSNICPITGWDGANVTRTGKNLFDKSRVTLDKYYNTALQELSSTGKAHSVLIPVKPSTRYYMSGYAGVGFYSIIALSDKNTSISTFFGGASKTAPFTAVLPSNCNYVYLNFNKDQLNTLMFCEVETATTDVPYEPFGNTYTVTWTSAGTVYGGTLDVTTGVLTVTHASVNLPNLEAQWGYAYGVFRCGVSNFPNIIRPLQNVKADCYCDKLNYTAFNSTGTLGDGCIGIGYTGADYVYVKFSQYTDVNDFISALGDTNFVYELATPQTFQLTPTEVKALCGQNNIWADCGDIENLVYFTIDEIEEE